MKPRLTGFWVRLSIPREAFETERVPGPQRNLSHTNERTRCQGLYTLVRYFVGDEHG